MDLLDTNYERCNEEWAKIKGLWETTIKEGPSAHKHYVGKQKEELEKKGCSQEPYWKEWGYLGFIHKPCNKDVYVNVNGPATDCRIGRRQFGGYGVGMNVVPTLEGNLSCSLGCLHISEVYEAMTNPTKMLILLTPFLDLLWDVTCVSDRFKRNPIDVRSVIIYKHHTYIKTSTDDKDEEVFIDKYCACSMIEASVARSLSDHLTAAYRALLND